MEKKKYGFRNGKKLSDLNKFQQKPFINLVDIKKTFLTGDYEVKLRVNRTGLNNILKISEDLELDTLK